MGGRGKKDPNAGINTGEGSAEAIEKVNATTTPAQIQQMWGRSIGDSSDKKEDVEQEILEELHALDQQETVTAVKDEITNQLPLPLEQVQSGTSGTTKKQSLKPKKAQVQQATGPNQPPATTATSKQATTKTVAASAANTKSKSKSSKAKKTLSPKTPTKYAAKDSDGKLMLLPKYRGTNSRNHDARPTLRTRFYGTRPDRKAREWMQECLAYPFGTTTPSGYKGIAHPTEPNTYYWKGNWYKNAGKTKATIDHRNPKVVEHWNTVGRNQTQKERRDFYSDFTNCEIAPRDANSIEGRLEVEETFNFEVGPNFRGPNEWGSR